ncbi:RHS repeat-associated core domain-containing protein [Pseudomonas sp. P1.31]|uniref:RHS repeat-associated core domain-containing protein n=1 Tax=Pseudomonas sp. P1.31 TaxID=1699311 RepID=UPI00069D801C|nr:RHS repeat-associated core domain-containing protein [Pseudomonas sp. P1.31]
MKATQHSPHPTLSVVDPRALAIRSVAYCQHPDKPEVEPRITRQIFDEVGREVAAWDPRLWGAAPKPNMATVYGLSGQVLLTDSVDAGWQLSLLEQAGSTLSFWDARGTQRHYEYDTQRRSVSVTEQMVSHPAKIVERLIYGDADEALAQHNQCGRLIRHDHPAGSRKCPSYGVAGSILTVQERFLEDLDTPDWPVDLPGRDALLEEQTFTTRSEFNPAGQLLKQIDACDNVQRFGYDIAGRSRDVWLQMAGEAKPPRKLVSDIRYNAQDQVEFETAGNGVIARADYDARDGRLTRLTAAIHPHKPLLDLHYCVDPVGNIVELEDKSQPVTYFNNQRIAPVCSYRYDSLYELIEAKGWEVSLPSHGPALPELIATPLDPAQRRNYLQKFVYDSGGNLVSRQHSATAGFAMFTSGNSNRSLGQRNDGSLPGEPEINAGFDKCGNQIELNRGQNMVWNTHNQLHEVALVSRENQQHDFECYRYDRPGHRVRKVSVASVAGRALRSQVRYLPGLELRQHNNGEEHHVINFIGGHNSVRMLHWPDGTHPDQLRYGLSDHLSSSTLELDDEGAILTLEHYYAFGSTACWAAKNASAANYKTHRYSGKERDSTGLYYYGYRYYAPWLQRWISSDPIADGLNLFAMVGNDPLNFVDPDGLTRVDAYNRWSSAYNEALSQSVAASGGVRVRTVAKGIISVDIVGGNELFNRLGIGLTRPVQGDRALSYLSIAPALRGKVAGSEQGFFLQLEPGQAIKAQAGLKSAGAVAYINGGFFNFRNGASEFISPFAPIGPTVISGKRQVYAPIPADYRRNYIELPMRDGSLINTAPLLSSNGEAVFTEKMLKQQRFQFTVKGNQPGKLGHADSPNIRSGISLPSTSGAEQRTRMARGNSTGRTAMATGYTMPEWSLVMARLEGMGGGGGHSVNLDGGYSSTLGVAGANGESLMRRPYANETTRPIGNFLVYYEKPQSRGLFKRLFS